MPEQTETCDIGGGMGVTRHECLSSNIIEGGHLGYRRVGHIPGTDLPLYRRGDDSDSQRFGQHQNVALSGTTRPDNVRFIDEACHRKAKGGLRAIDGMTAQNRAARPSHDIKAPFDHPGGQFQRQLIAGPCQVIEGGKRCATHGVDVAQGIGRGDPPPVMRVVHNWGEDINCLNQGATVPQRENAGVIGPCQPDQEVGMARGGMVFDGTQNLRQLGGAELAGSARPVAISSETDIGHGRQS